jgi:glycosyltransferase involved in cell wall biosynthesis
MSRRLHVLYVVYWGAAEPLGQSLVLPAIERLSRAGVRFTLVTFEKPADLERDDALRSIRDRLEACGARWIPARYHKRPKLPATAYDVFQGAVRSALAEVRGAVDLVHGRTFVGGTMGRLASRLLRVPFVFHNEGFYPDEQVDGGVWRKGSAMHRIAGRLEGMLYDHADGVIVLSERARSVVASRPRVAARQVPVVVVPSVVDLQVFPLAPRPAPSPETLRLVYVGSVGVRYLLDAVARFVVVAGDVWPRIELRVLSPADRGLVAEMLTRGGLPADRWSLDTVPHAQMPRELAGHDAGLFFLTQGLSEHGCSPTKIGEYWASGLPVVTTPNVSDTDAIVREERVGVVVEDHTAGGYRKAARELRELLRDPGLRERCRRAAERHYSLDTACDRQLALYRRVLGPGK